MRAYNLVTLSCLSGIMREAEGELVKDQMKDFSADQMWELSFFTVSLSVSVFVRDCQEMLHGQFIWKLKKNLEMWEWIY